jgi:hypothetical protein
MEGFKSHLRGWLANRLRSEGANGFSGLYYATVDLLDVDTEEKLQLKVGCAVERVSYVGLVGFVRY